jgi:transposase
MSKKPREFTPEFKLQAVNLILNDKVPPTKIARDLDIGTQNLKRWIGIHQQSILKQHPAFTGRGIAALTEQERRIQKLERENYILRQKREILKAVTKFFLTLKMHLVS